MTLQLLPVLINEWNELNLGLHIIEGLEGQVDICAINLFLLEFNKLLEGHVSCESLQNLFFGSLKGVWNDNCHHLLHLDE